MTTHRTMSGGKLEWRSLAIGLLAGVTLVTALGARRGPAKEPPRTFPKYQVAAWGGDKDSHHGAFMVDTETGQVVAILGRTYVASGRVNGEYAVQEVAPVGDRR